MRFEPDLRAAPIGGDGMGVWCDDTGVFIEPRIPLVEGQSDEFGGAQFAPTPAEHINKVLSRGYGKRVDITLLLPGLTRVAAALEKGDLALASIALAHLRIPPFQSLAHGRLAADTDALLKASPDDPLHPGWPKGAPEGKGGQFAPKGTAQTDAASPASTLPSEERANSETQIAALDPNGPECLQIVRDAKQTCIDRFENGSLGWGGDSLARFRICVRRIVAPFGCSF